MHDCGEAHDDGRLDTGRLQEVGAGEVGDVVSHLRGGKGCIRSTTAMKRTSGIKHPSIAPRRSPWPPSPWHGRRARECALDGNAQASRPGGSPRAGRVLGDQLRKTERRAWGASRGDLVIIVMITAPDLPLSTAPSVFDVSYLPGSYLCLSPSEPISHAMGSMLLEPYRSLCQTDGQYGYAAAAAAHLSMMSYCSTQDLQRLWSNTVNCRRSWGDAARGSQLKQI